MPMSSSNITYAPTPTSRVCYYHAFTTGLPVLTRVCCYQGPLRLTDIAYGATRPAELPAIPRLRISYAISGTGIAYHLYGAALSAYTVPLQRPRVVQTGGTAAASGGVAPPYRPTLLLRDAQYWHRPLSLSAYAPALRRV
eukprot:2759311-Rhodomonas_salina.1